MGASSANGASALGAKLRRVENAPTDLRAATAVALLDPQSHQQRLAECRDLVCELRRDVDGAAPAVHEAGSAREAATRYCDAALEALTLHAETYDL